MPDVTANMLGLSKLGGKAAGIAALNYLRMRGVMPREKTILQEEAERRDRNLRETAYGQEYPMEEALSPLDVLGPGALLKARKAAVAGYEGLIGIERVGLKGGTEYLNLKKMPMIEWDVNPRMTHAIRRPVDPINVTVEDVARDINDYLLRSESALRIHETPSGVHMFDMSQRRTPWQFYNEIMPPSTGNPEQFFVPHRDILYDLYSLRRGGYGVRIGPKVTEEGAVRAGDFVARPVGTIGTPRAIKDVPLVNRLAMKRVEKLIERGGRLGTEGRSRIPGAAVVDAMDRQGLQSSYFTRNVSDTGPIGRIVSSTRTGRRVPGYGEYDRAISQREWDARIALAQEEMRSGITGPENLDAVANDAVQNAMRSGGYYNNRELAEIGYRARQEAQLRNQLRLQAYPASRGASYVAPDTPLHPLPQLSPAEQAARDEARKKLIEARDVLHGRLTGILEGKEGHDTLSKRMNAMITASLDAPEESHGIFRGTLSPSLTVDISPFDTGIAGTIARDIVVRDPQGGMMHYLVGRAAQQETAASLSAYRVPTRPDVPVRFGDYSFFGHTSGGPSIAGGRSMAIMREFTNLPPVGVWEPAGESLTSDSFTAVANMVKRIGEDPRYRLSQELGDWRSLNIGRSSGLAEKYSKVAGMEETDPLVTQEMAKFIQKYTTASGEPLLRQNPMIPTLLQWRLPTWVEKMYPGLIPFLMRRDSTQQQTAFTENP